MEWAAVWKGLRTGGNILKNIYHTVRFRVRARAELSWAHAPIYIPGIPTTYWRRVRVTVTAPKKEEFVISKVRMQVRVPGEKWHDVGEDDLVHLPVPVPAGREGDIEISGTVIADSIAWSEVTPVADLRFIVSDFYGVSAETGAISVSRVELTRERQGN